ncbi:NAD-dependent protein deacylase [Daphnia magna]|uniref:NAD-dependent protein deacylase n=1 Tax=Daphnia magna TaxID=35525 RepID=UPI001E1BD92F|nr:NAD-dependent protein deacylase [Daphnia magna]XP_032783234.2 NAD-dependent protein deacylase [Daphnia magna]
MSVNPSADMDSFRKLLLKVNAVVILTGAGVSAESGVPTFRGAGGLWRIYSATDLATPSAFRSNPSLVWEFYHHRRENVASKHPNNAHKAIAEFEHRLTKQGKHVSVITQNIDELHQRAGSVNILELHGSLFKTRCLKCKKVESNYDSPICEALKGKGSASPTEGGENIPELLLPRCKVSSCGGLLRPYVVWFHENLDPIILKKAEKDLNSCDLCLVVGTSSIVYPAAMFAPQVAARGVPVAEFNMETTSATPNFEFHFSGPCGELLPIALAP